MNEVPYVLVNRLTFDVVLCTSRRRVATVMGMTYDGLRKRGFDWGGDEYGDWVMMGGVKIERQRKGFGR